uniref:CTD small phosphatase like n=1 Tax=Sinocyclocheilus grahami TaxID=75366 RepID=A0A672NVW3_SINGR
MDNTSIITQVANPKEEEILSSCQEKVSQSNSSLKKHRNRSIFSPFFCCFRDYNAEPPATNNKTCSLPPPAEENSSPPKPPAKYLLPEVSINDYGKNCVVIDLDETLVHSSFKPISNADFIVPVEIDGTVHQVPLLTKLSPLLNLDCVFFVLQCHHNLDKPCQIEMKGILRLFWGPGKQNWKIRYICKIGTSLRKCYLSDFHIKTILTLFVTSSCGYYIDKIVVKIIEVRLKNSSCGCQIFTVKI